MLKKIKKKHSQESARTSERLRSIQALMKAVDLHGESQANIAMGGPLWWWSQVDIVMVGPVANIAMDGTKLILPWRVPSWYWHGGSHANIAMEGPKLNDTYSNPLGLHRILQ